VEELPKPPNENPELLFVLELPNENPDVVGLVVEVLPKEKPEEAPVLLLIFPKLNPDVVGFVVDVLPNEKPVVAGFVVALDDPKDVFPNENPVIFSDL